MIRPQWKRGFLLAVFLAGAAAILIQFRRAEARPEPAAAAAGGKADAQYCILFGVGSAEEASWNGSVQANGARIVKLDGWRLTEGETVEGNRWTISSHPVDPSRGAATRAPFEPGVYLTAELLDSDASFDVQTAQGDFSFSANEAAFGKTLSFLSGQVTVERVPVTSQLTDSVEEQDHPATAMSGDTVYLAYVEFTHGDRSQAWPRQLKEKPASFDPLKRPVGGDQVMLMEYSKSKRTWSAPQPVSAVGQDVFGVAVAVDGGKRVWVIWSAQADRNFDLYARRREKRDWSSEIRLTDSPGPDLNPAAVTDSDGAVWVAWQGYRGNNFDILVSRQERAAFSTPHPVSASLANDWAPRIAAGKSGEVAVAWDTYHKGDYDVFVRRLHYKNSIGMETPLPVAATRKFEARASIAYDASNRLWVAYEESFPGWGKDFGAYETTGSGLYQGNTVRVKVLEGNRHFETSDSLDAVLDRRAASHPVNRRPRQGIEHTDQPNPELAKNRPKGTTPYPRDDPSKSHPRLMADEHGGVVLAYRNAVGRIRVPLGTTWFENIAYFDGAKWTGPIFAPGSDGLLDSRPALSALGDGRFLMIGTTDHRLGAAADPGDASESDKYNYDLMAYEFSAGKASRQAQLTALEPARVEPPASDAGAEIQQVAMMRNYRAALGSEKLQLLRGEFHRHTEISSDGGGDGGLIDAWRYMLDAAYMDWVGCCDHDNGNGREYTWWITQKMTDAFYVPGKFIPMFSHERSVRYPEGHRNVIFAQRGIRALPRLPKTADDSPPEPAPDTQMLYEYLELFDGIAAVHTSATNMGTDWRDNDPKVEPVVEIYQGDRQNYEMPGAPRSNSAEDSIGGWRPLGFVSLALEKGYRLAFQASSDHFSTHMSYCNLWVTEPTRQGVLEAFKKRRVYGATDNILADVRCGNYFMGEEFTLREAPKIDVKLVGTGPFAQVHIIKDGKHVYSIEPGAREVSFSWRDNAPSKGKTSYYYVRGEQTDGELVWVSPMWITVE